MDASDSEEEILVFAEFDEHVKIEKYRSIHALGLDSKNPVIQMDDSFFTGKYSSPVGTFMFFEDDLAPQSDPLFDKTPCNRLKYLCKTRKYINMEHAYVTPKEGKGLELNYQAQQPEDDIEVPKFESIQEAVEKFKNSWNASDEPKVDPIAVSGNNNVDQAVSGNNNVEQATDISNTVVESMEVQ